MIQGVEYEVNYGIPGNPLTDVHQHNAPCAVCLIPTRSTTIMIPAKSVCPSNWTREYYGFLMSEHDGYYRTSYDTLALILILNQFQGQAVTLIPHSFTTLLLIVMGFHVHRMRIIVCSHVWCAQSDQEHDCIYISQLNMLPYRTKVLECVLA